ncbi:NAD(P)H-binding protein [Enterococcus timonensis]|uniref:NAD(P)H-binding protein n=1 Tax=Enterococcus timonensis TaxID=1852364 RepID=UPI0008DAB5F5|nr:NAD(P)H-binding protein [Enterococcus timonensis]
METVLILGANGKIARIVAENLKKEPWQAVLFLRKSNRLATLAQEKKFTLFEGDAAYVEDLKKAMTGVSTVYANLAGKNIEQLAKNVVEAMQEAQVKRLIWISTLGIYDEVPGKFGQWNHEMLDGGYLETYAAAADVIEKSHLDWTIIRPAWLSDQPEIAYETTTRMENFKGTEVSRASVADLVVHLLNHPQEEIHESLGVNKPNTDGDKPSWY